MEYGTLIKLLTKQCILSSHFHYSSSFTRNEIALETLQSSFSLDIHESPLMNSRSLTIIDLRCFFYGKFAWLTLRGQMKTIGDCQSFKANMENIGIDPLFCRLLSGSSLIPRQE